MQLYTYNGTEMSPFTVRYSSILDKMCLWA